MFNTFWGCSHQNPGEPPTFSVENLQHMAEMTITALVLLFGLDCGLPTKQVLCTKLPLGPFGTAKQGLVFNTFWGCSHQNPGEPPPFSVENLQHMAEMTITALVLLFGLDCGLPTKQVLCTKLPLGPFGTAKQGLVFNTFWGCSHQNPGEPPPFSVENLQHMAEMTITALVLLFGLDCGLPTKQVLCTKLPLGPFGGPNTAKQGLVFNTFWGCSHQNPGEPPTFPVEYLQHMAEMIITALVLLFGLDCGLPTKQILCTKLPLGPFGGPNIAKQGLVFNTFWGCHQNPGVPPTFPGENLQHMAEMITLSVVFQRSKAFAQSSH